MIELQELETRIKLYEQGYWEIPDNLDVSGFDFEWRPDPYDKPYIHQFGTQWQKTGGPRFVIPSATEIKYVDCQRAIHKPIVEDRGWRPLLPNCTMDFSWHPDDTDPPYIYVFGNQWYDVDIMPTYQYRVKGATEKKYMYDVKARLLANRDNWIEPEFLDYEFDYSWVPHPHEPPFIWVFGTQWQKNGGPKYVSPGATQKKLCSDQKCSIIQGNMRAWRMLKPNLTIDISWHPDEDDPPYNYVFGNQWYTGEKMPTVIYRVKGATEKKYVNMIKATLNDYIEKFVPLTNRKFTFDYSWCPDPDDPPYNYVFGNQHHSSKDMPTVMYPVQGATETKYMDNIKATLLPDLNDWEVPVTVDTKDFDFSWYPSQFEEPAVFQFGTQWQKTGGPKLNYKNGTKVKYVEHMRVTNLPNNNRGWRPLYSNIEFDYSWHPDDNEPPYIYVFGNQWYSAEKMPTLLYRVKGATEKKYMDINCFLTDKKDNFKSLVELDFSFDYSWVPDPDDPPYNYVFGNQWHDSVTMPTLMYCVPNAVETKYIDNVYATLKPNKSKWLIPANTDDSRFDYSWVPNPKDPPYIYQFGTQHQRTGGPQYIVDNANELKFIDTQKVIRLASVDRNFRPLYSNMTFDYSWHPDDTEAPYNYVFGNQWYNAEKMPTVMYRIKGATETKYINTVKAQLLEDKSKWQIPQDIDDSMFDYSWVPDPGEPKLNYQFGTQWQKNGGPEYITKGATDKKYISLQSVIKLPNQRNFRIIEPVDNFDFSWHPDDTEQKYNYIFGNKFHTSEIMPTIMYKGKGSENKYNNEIKAELQIARITYEDSIFDAFIEDKSQQAYIHITNNEVVYRDITSDKVNVHLFGDEAIVPRSVKMYLYDKLTDYDHVITHFNPEVKPLDIIFISNGEICADENYEHLLKIANGRRVVRIDRVNGRVASQHAAAKASNTPWYFLVNAKLRVNDNFDFDWQPNIYKSRRHYIFNATNPLNGLEYGHQAIVANNRKLTLETTVKGLDFTMDSRTEVTNINSGISTYDVNEWDVYRTAFREAIKLAYNKDIVSKKRLEVWTTVGSGKYGQLSINGAKAGLDYFNSVNGELTKLMLSYDWDWIKTYYNKNK